MQLHAYLWSACNACTDSVWGRTNSEQTTCPPNTWTVRSRILADPELSAGAVQGSPAWQRGARSWWRSGTPHAIRASPLRLSPAAPRTEPGGCANKGPVATTTSGRWDLGLHCHGPARACCRGLLCSLCVKIEKSGQWGMHGWVHVWCMCRAARPSPSA